MVIIKTFFDKFQSESSTIIKFIAVPILQKNSIWNPPKPLANFHCRNQNISPIWTYTKSLTKWSFVVFKKKWPPNWIELSQVAFIENCKMEFTLPKKQWCPFPLNSYRKIAVYCIIVTHLLGQLWKWHVQPIILNSVTNWRVDDVIIATLQFWENQRIHACPLVYEDEV